DDVHVAVERDALRFELGLLGVDVLDQKRDMRRSDAVRLQRLGRLARRALVLEELERGVSEEQAYLSQPGTRNAHRGAELRRVEPRARLVRELQAEDVVVEADRGVEVLYGDSHVMQTLHGSSVSSSGSSGRDFAGRGGPTPCRRRPALGELPRCARRRRPPRPEARRRDRRRDSPRATSFRINSVAKALISRTTEPGRKRSSRPLST